MQIKKKGLKISAFLLSLAFLIPITALARHKRRHQDNQHYVQEEPTQKKDRTVLGSTLGFSALGAITAGAAGSGKFVPVGIFGGALAGWVIGKAIKHSKNKKKQKPKKNHVVRKRKHSYAY